MSVEGKAREEIKEEAICDLCNGFQKKMDIGYDSSDYDDWFEDDNQKVVCTFAQRVICSGLRPYEVKNIKKPDWCPKNE